MTAHAALDELRLDELDELRAELAEMTDYVRRLRAELQSAAAKWESDHGSAPAQWVALLEETADV